MIPEVTKILNLEYNFPSFYLNLLVQGLLRPRMRAYPSFLVLKYGSQGQGQGEGFYVK